MRSTRSWLILALRGPVPVYVFVPLFAAAMLQFGWIGSNFNSIAMEPLGHVAGTASSILGFMQTLGGGVIGAGIGQLFNGTVTPLAAGFCSVSALALVFVLIAEKGQLFHAAREADTLAEVNSDASSECLVRMRRRKRSTALCLFAYLSYPLPIPAQHDPKPRR